MVSPSTAAALHTPDVASLGRMEITISLKDGCIAEHPVKSIPASITYTTIVRWIKLGPGTQYR